ncbi:MAG: NAD(P)-dependent glycerol-3-phosphate dehydrogenase [Candidatus Dormibacteraeota bacterium]|nr:NAD(P)-dependent glycerol-3-phosphate dehydrogenase [Candidatus Dormibacteraeota bacterium]
MRVRIAVVGAGSWGMALAQALARDGDREVSLWARHQDLAAEIARTRHNPRYLSDMELDASVEVTADPAACVHGCGIVVLAVPTHGMRDVATLVAPHLQRDCVIVSGAKGFEERTSLTMSGVLADVLGSGWDGAITALSGPNIAVEVARGLPAASVVAGESHAAERVRDACSSSSFRVYSTADRVGVEYGGALKNVLAIAVGACDGMGVGDNGKAAILTRGIAEIARLGVRRGANVMTFAGLAGLGDCVVTCTSPHSRNRQLGEAIGRGASLEEAMQQVRMVVEGVSAARVAARLAAKHGVDMPITREVNAVLFEGKPVDEALADLMSRDPAEELRGLAPRDGLD